MNKEHFIYDLKHTVLPFWRGQMDTQNGGFYGAVNIHLKKQREAPKGGVMTSRFLFAFSKVYPLTKDEKDLYMAEHAYHFLSEKLLDPVYGGIYWMVDKDGTPLDTRKVTYAQAFAIYGLSAYEKVKPEQGAKEKALQLFHLLEEKVWNETGLYYEEEFLCDYTEKRSEILTLNQGGASHTTNTFLHILEAFTALYEVTQNPVVLAKTELLLEVFHERVYISERYCAQSFYKDWSPVHDAISYGHDIETAWILTETLSILPLKDPLKEKIHKMNLCLAGTSLKEGIHRSGALFSDSREKHHPIFVWWAQAEAVIGFYDAYEKTGQKDYLDAASKVYDYIANFFIDKRPGSEWYSRLSEKGVPLSLYFNNHPDPEHIADHWKGPYHTVRYYLEMIRRTGGKP